MRNIQGIAGCIAVAAVVAGCAAQPPAPPIAAAPASLAAGPNTASSGGAIDGVYRAPPGGISGNSRCGTTKFGYPIRVAGGVASMSTVANGVMEGPVGPDNSLAIEKGRAGLRGQFADGKFVGTYGSGGGCAFTLTYAKR